MSVSLPDSASPLLAEFSALGAALKVHDYRGAVESLRKAGNALMEQERFTDALELHQSILRTLPDSLEASELGLWCLLGVGNAYFDLDQENAAEAAYEEMISRALAVSDNFLRSVALARLGDLARKRDLPAQAEQFYRESLPAKIESGDFFGTIEVLLWLATLSEEGGQWEQASKPLSTAENILTIVRRAVSKEGTDDDAPIRQDCQYWEMALRFQQASLMRAQGDLPKAERIYRRALRSAVKRKDTVAEAKLLQNLANGLVEQGRARQALPLYERSLEIARQNGLNETERQVRLGLAVALFRLKRYAESIPHYEASREAAREESNESLWASLTADTGAVRIGAGELENGTALLDQALAYYQKAGDLTWQERILSNLLLADARQGEGERLQAHLRECLNLLPKAAFKERHSLYRYVGNLYLDTLKNAPGAARFFRQAVEEACAGGDLPEAGQTAALAAASLSKEGAYGEALALFDRAAEIFRETGDEANLWRTRNDRGIALVRTGSYEEAVEEFATCLRLASERQDRPSEAQALLNMSEVERLIGEVDVAVAHAGKALTLYQEIESRHGELDARNALGLCLLEEHPYGGADRTEETSSHFEQALQIAKHLRDRSQEAMAARGLARVAERRGEVTAALRLYRRAADLWEREGDFGHCTEALAAQVTLQIVRLDARRWQEDVRRLLEVAVKGGAVGTAAHGIVGAALHMIEMGAPGAAADFVLIALRLHQSQTALAVATHDPEAAEAKAGDDFYRTVSSLVSAMERLMDPEERAAFLDQITKPENFSDPEDGNTLREVFEQVQEEMRESLFEQEQVKE